MQTKQISLKDYTTMRVGALAQLMVPETVHELQELLVELKKTETSFYVLGGGSNTIASDRFGGVVIKLNLVGLTISEDGWVVAHASEAWDRVVRKASSLGLCGIEALASIPGTVGAAPVQNIGAYGQEVAEVIHSVTVIDTDNIERGEYELKKSECDFSYRNSLFKKNSGRYVITKITMQLEPARERLTNFLHASCHQLLQAYLKNNNITDLSPQTITAAVTEVRKICIPDPTILPNSGSFFKNPILNQQEFLTLQAKFPEIPNWPMPDDAVKVPAGWLLEQAGLKGYKTECFGTFENNAVVIINHNNGNYEQLIAFRDQLNRMIMQKFGFQLEQEPFELT